MPEPERAGFWTSLPGILLGIAAVITALTSGWLAFRPKPGDQPAQQVVGPTGVAPPAAGDPATDAATGVTPPPRANLIAVANGGRLAVSSSANWDKMIDGDENTAVQIGEHVGDFGVYAFNAGRTARIDRFTTTVPEASPGNPATIDLAYSTGSADGPYIPIGTVTVKNVRVAPDGRQMFRLTPVDARFFKIKVSPTSSGSPYVMAYEFGVLGTLE